MARINIEEKISQEERQWELIKANIEQLPLEEKLTYAEYVKEEEERLRQKRSIRLAKVKAKRKAENIRFAWELTKFVAGIAVGIVGLWAWVSLMAIM